MWQGWQLPHRLVRTHASLEPTGVLDMRGQCYQTHVKAGTAVSEDTADMTGTHNAWDTYDCRLPANLFTVRALAMQCLGGVRRPPSVKVVTMIHQLRCMGYVLACLPTREFAIDQ